MPQSLFQIKAREWASWGGKAQDFSVGKRAPIFIGRVKLKLQYFGHLMRRADSLKKIQILEKIEGRRRRG